MIFGVEVDLIIDLIRIWLRKQNIKFLFAPMQFFNFFIILICLRLGLTHFKNTVAIRKKTHSVNGSLVPWLSTK